MCHYARRTIVRADLSAEILSEHKLRSNAYRTGEDILFIQIDINGGTLVHDGLMYGTDVIPIEIGTCGQLKYIAEKTGL